MAIDNKFAGPFACQNCCCATTGTTFPTYECCISGGLGPATCTDSDALWKWYLTGGVPSLVRDDDGYGYGYGGHCTNAIECGLLEWDEGAAEHGSQRWSLTYADRDATWGKLEGWIEANETSPGVWAIVAWRFERAGQSLQWVNGTISASGPCDCTQLGWSSSNNRKLYMSSSATLVPNQEAGAAAAGKWTVVIPAWTFRTQVRTNAGQPWSDEWLYSVPETEIVADISGDDEYGNAIALDPCPSDDDPNGRTGFVNRLAWRSGTVPGPDAALTFYVNPVTNFGTQHDWTLQTQARASVRVAAALMRLDARNEGSPGSLPSIIPPFIRGFPTFNESLPNRCEASGGLEEFSVTFPALETVSTVTAGGVPVGQRRSTRPETSITFTPDVP